MLKHLTDLKTSAFLNCGREKNKNCEFSKTRKKQNQKENSAKKYNYY